MLRPVVAIICAKDEGPRIQQVLKPVILSNLFRNILVIDDGSTDDTVAKALELNDPKNWGTDDPVIKDLDLNVRVVSHPVNLGKAQAMQTGVYRSLAPVICFLDADLKYLTTRHLQDLVLPVSIGSKRATLGVFKGGFSPTTLAQWISPGISGQRCIERELLRTHKEWGTGYEVETRLEAHLQKEGIPRTLIPWQGASQVTKEEKLGIKRGVQSRITMYRDILRARRAISARK